jgi:hypothetical protein
LEAFVFRTLFLSLFLVSTVFAGEVVVVGEGNSRSDAMIDALSNGLSKFISAGVDPKELKKMVLSGGIDVHSLTAGRVQGYKILKVHYAAGVYQAEIQLVTK